MKCKIDKIEDIDEKFLGKIRKDDEIIFDIDKIPNDIVFGYLIREIVLVKDAIIVDNINNTKIKKDYSCENTYKLEDLENNIICKRFGIGKIACVDKDYILFPVGAVVQLSDDNKCYIIGRGLTQIIEDKEYYTDYMGAIYPLGIQGDERIFFNHEDIRKLLHVGMQNEETDEVDLSIKEWLDSTDIHKYILEK